MKKIATLLFVLREGKILLGMKKRGFGVGRWNGFGGKLEEGEAIEQAVVRETREECAITPLNIKKFGILDFEFAHKSEWNQQVHFFSAERFEGNPEETEEMSPAWFSFDKIPFENMWPDDRFWMPIFLSGKKFKGKFVFGENEEILEHEIQEVDGF